MRRLRIRPLVAWYDLWIGVFVDRPKRRLYVFLVPCLGLVIEWPTRRPGAAVISTKKGNPYG